MKSRNNVLLLVVIFSLGGVAFGGADQSPLRIVRGRVLDAHNLPLPSAIVYLQNLRIQRIRTFITDKQGRYHFAGLIPFDDYTRCVLLTKAGPRKHTHFLTSILNRTFSSI